MFMMMMMMMISCTCIVARFSAFTFRSDVALGGGVTWNLVFREV